MRFQTGALRGVEVTGGKLGMRRSGGAWGRSWRAQRPHQCVFYCFTPSARPAGGAGAEEGERKPIHPKEAAACAGRWSASSQAFLLF